MDWLLSVATFRSSFILDWCIIVLCDFSLIWIQSIQLKMSSIASSNLFLSKIHPTFAYGFDTIRLCNDCLVNHTIVVWIKAKNLGDVISDETLSYLHGVLVLHHWHFSNEDIPFSNVTFVSGTLLSLPLPFALLLSPTLSFSFSLSQLQLQLQLCCYLSDLREFCTPVTRSLFEYKVHFDHRETECHSHRIPSLSLSLLFSLLFSVLVIWVSQTVRLSNKRTIYCLCLCLYICHNSSFQIWLLHNIFTMETSS